MNPGTKRRSGVLGIGSDHRGAVAVLFAALLVPLIVAGGVAVDFARLSVFRSELQQIADGAVLAGASSLSQPSGQASATQLANSYFTSGLSALPDQADVGTPSITTPNAITVTISVSASLPTTFMSLFTATMPIQVSATARGPGFAIKVVPKAGGVFSSYAADYNYVYYYIVPPDGSLPSIPEPIGSNSSSMTLLFSNDPGQKIDNTKTQVMSVNAGDQVGFALVNVTGGTNGVNSYGNNAYGAAPGSGHIFYSSAPIPSQIAYTSSQSYTTGQMKNTTIFGIIISSKCQQSSIKSSVYTYSTYNEKYSALSSTNCNAHPCVTVPASGSFVGQNSLLVGTITSSNTDGTNDACSSPPTNPSGTTVAASTAVRTCTQLYETPVSYRWNDMGGITDDFDYDDADYTVSCVPNTASGTGVTNQPDAVVLVQ